MSTDHGDGPVDARRVVATDDAPTDGAPDRAGPVADRYATAMALELAFFDSALRAGRP